MSIVLNQPKIVAESQTIKFDELHIIGGGSDKLSALVSFVILDQDGNQIDAIQLKYDGADYNTFWTAFNSGEYLYQQLITDQQLQVSVTNAIESDFLNPS